MPGADGVTAGPVRPEQPAHGIVRRSVCGSCSLNGHADAQSLPGVGYAKRESFAYTST